MMKLQSINPASGAEIKTYEEHSPAEVERRVQLAYDGWKTWSATPMAERSAFLMRMAALLDERADQYGKLIVSEMGKPIGEAIGEVKKCALGARHFEENGPAYLADEAIPGTPARIVYDSIGPIFAIMPWNLPFWQVLRLFSPTALVGNSLIVKHAESVQGCAEAIEQLVRDAGGPEGLYVNLAIQREESLARHRRPAHPRRDRDRVRLRWAGGRGTGRQSRQEGGAGTGRLRPVPRL